MSFVRGTEVPAVQAQIDQIRALGAPAGDQATVKKMLDLAQQAVGRVRVVPTILTTGEDVFAPFAACASLRPDVLRARQRALRLSRSRSPVRRCL